MIRWRAVSCVAGETDHCTLEHSRSCRREGFARSNRPRICLPNVVAADRHPRLAPNRQVGRGFITDEVAGDRANGGRNQQG